MIRAILLSLLVSISVAGCFGAESRSEWAYDVTQIDAARERGRTGEGIRIGVLDTGIDPSHVSLDHMVDGDRSNGELRGFRDLIDGRGGIDNAHDDVGHGTHVIGIMAARGSSFGHKLLYGGIDLQGAAPSAQYYVARVCTADNCPADAIADALDWLSDVRVDVVSLSLGGARDSPLIINDQIRNSIDGLIDDGVVVVASAGNGGRSDNDVNAPADIPGVIAVGAIDEDGTLADISSHGDNTGLNNECRDVLLGGEVGRCDPNKKPELVAPGVNILSAWNDGAYARATGTSQAAPFVSSAVALMLEGRAKPTNRADVLCIKEVLMETAAPLPGQTRPHDDGSGYGLIQTLAAINGNRC